MIQCSHKHFITASSGQGSFSEEGKLEQELGDWIDLDERKKKVEHSRPGSFMESECTKFV